MQIGDLFNKQYQMDLLASTRYREEQAKAAKRKEQAWERSVAKARGTTTVKAAEYQQRFPLKHICQDWLGSKVKVECPACVAERRS